VDLGAVLIAAGAGIFFLVVWKGSSTSPRPDSVEAMFMSRWRRMVIVSWIAAVLGSMPLVIRADSPGKEGLRLGLLLIGGLTWLVAGPGGWSPAVRHSSDPAKHARGRQGDPVPLLSWMLAVGALSALLLSTALSGHARGSSLPFPNLLVALIHVTAAAAWVGGLVSLVALAFPAMRDQAETDRAALLVPVVARFSDVAVWAVFAIVASGTYSAWMEIRGLHAVTASTYGLVFLAKLAAFVPVLALGGVNNRWTKPRLMRAVRGQAAAGSSLRLLRRLIALEIALIAVVLGLTVFLLQLSPPALAGGSS
jgi:uncharacterized membrane protein